MKKSENQDKIKIIIVEDEETARNKLKRDLSDYKDIEIIAECSSGIEAVKAIIQKKPDVVFLDINLPEMSGFEIIETVGLNNLPYIIFITAYDEFAVRAFEINAVDYILKPFDKTRLNTALKKAKDLLGSNKIEHKNTEKLLNEIRLPLSRLLIKHKGRIRFIKTDEIDWIEAADYCILIHLKNEVYSYNESMKKIERLLDPDKFIRTHRSTIVNIDSIKEIQPWSKNKHKVILKNGTCLTLSRNYKNKLLDHFLF